MQYAMENKTVRLPKDMEKQVAKGAEKHNMTEAEYIRTAIRQLRMQDIVAEEGEA